MKKALYTIILPLLTALIWGTAFSMQRMAVAHLSPFSLNGIRFIMGGVLLLLVNLVRVKRFGLRIASRKSGCIVPDDVFSASFGRFLAANSPQNGRFAVCASCAARGGVRALVHVFIPADVSRDPVGDSVRTFSARFCRFRETWTFSRLLGVHPFG